MLRPPAAIKPIEDKSLLGISMMLVAVLLFTGVDISAKWLVLSGVPSLEVVFARYSVHLVIVLAVFVPTQGLALFRTHSPKLELVRALSLLFSTVTNFIAVRYLPLTVTGSIVFAMPMILTVLSVPILGERVGWRRWLAIIAGFAGVLIIVRPGGETFHPAIFLSLVSVTCYAFYNIFNRKLAGVDSPYTQQLYSALIATCCIAPFAFSAWVWPQDGAGWVAFFALGIFGGVGHLLLTMAHRLAQASTLAPFVYPQIIYLTAASWLIFDQAPDAAVFIGAPIVIGAGLYIWLREKQLAVKPTLAAPVR